MDALVRDQADASAMVSIYALISRMRMASNANVVENAEAVIRTILTTYSRPNKTFPELQNIMLNRGFVDPLLTFSEVCRDELRDSSQGSSARRNLLVRPIVHILDQIRTTTAEPSPQLFTSDHPVNARVERDVGCFNSEASILRARSPTSAANP